MQGIWGIIEEKQGGQSGWKKVKVRELQESEHATPKVNFVVSTYYKGTGIEKLNKKLEEYLDSADPDENLINYI